MNQLVIGVIMLVIWFGVSLPGHLQTKRLKNAYQTKAEQCYLVGDRAQGDLYTSMYARMR